MKAISKSSLYNEEFFRDMSALSLQSAKAIIPLILNYTTPRSVVDLGCGTGAWLTEWEKHGVTDILGIDGNYIKTDQLLINREKFMSADLESNITLTRKFDLAISLEVAEHIREEHAGDFIHSLCNMSSLVLFSAAIPGQGGVLHINEQYPDYWIKLFAANGFSPYDCIRDKIWNDANINTCYRQNILFFVKDSVQDKFPAITFEKKNILALVHPEHYDLKERIINDYKKIVKTPFHASWFFLKKYGKIILKALGLAKKNPEPGAFNKENNS